MFSDYLNKASDVEVENVLYIAYYELMLDNLSPRMFDSILQGVRSSEAVRPMDHRLDGICEHFRSEITKINSEITADETVPNELQSNSGETHAQTSYVGIERHFPGLNDNMSGAVQCCDETVQLFPVSKYRDSAMDGENRRMSCASDDATVSRFEYIDDNMPFKIVTKDGLGEMDVFSNPQKIDNVPDGWLTTVWGIERALEEVNNIQDTEDNIENPIRSYMDDDLLNALAARGGYAPEGKAVVYPEDIIPCIGSNWTNHDPEYWYWMRRQVDIWEEIDMRE